MSAGHIPGTHKRTDIEGLRAVAVALVILYHLRISAFSGGYVGVDVFFVVSGFLITQILINEIDESGTIHLRDFWARRMRRIFPMACLVVVLTMIAAYLYLEPGRADESVPVALGAIGFCANIVLNATTGDYLSGVTLPSPLRHYWSLGVEEQFYVVWPLLLVMVVRLAKRQWRFWTILLSVSLFAWSLIESIRITPTDHGAAYYLPHTRAWEILAGAFLAIGGAVFTRVPRVVAVLVGWVGLGAMIYAAVTFNEETVFPGSLALVPVLGAVGVLIAAETKGGPVAILSLAPLQRIGLWSFSLYLWHWPVIVVLEAQFGLLSNGEKIGVVALCLLLSAISYTIVEHPVQWSKFLSARPQRTFAAGFSVLALLLATGGVLMAERAPRDDTPEVAVPENLDEASDASTLPMPPTTAAVPAAPTDAATTTTVAPVITPINALLIGDSVLAELRWFEQGQVSLQGFEYTLDAESCRRIARSSCSGREDRTPEDVVTVLTNMTTTFDVIVLLGGYHASTDSIRDEIAAFVEVAHTKADNVVIVNFKESLAYPAPGSDGTRSMYTDFNETLRAMEAEGALGDATIADWNLFSYEGSAWFRSDAMHPNIVGTLAMGWFISATLASLYNNPCPVWGTYPCVVPEIADPNIDWLAVYGVPYTDTHCYEDGADRVRVCEEDRIM